MSISMQDRSAGQSSPDSAADDLLSKIAALAPTMAARAAEAEAARRIPADIFEMLKSAGIFRMTAPRIYGGLELDYLAVGRVLQALTRIDGSIGWIGAVAGTTAVLLPLLPRETYAALYRNGPDVFLAGSGQPTGTATVEDRGLRASGRWAFASGCEDADWITGFCVLTEDGKPVPGPVEGTPAVRAVCLPADRWQIEDTWHASGLRATGSHHIVLKDAFVPAENVVDIVSARPCMPGPLYHAPWQFTALMHGPIALGLAQGALEDIIVIAQSGRTQQRAAVPMRDSEIFRYEIGRAQAEYRAAQALFDAQAAGQWRQALSGTPEPACPELTQSMVWLTEACLRVVQTCFALAGGAAVYDSWPLQRRLRDMQTAAQHAIVQRRHYAEAGKLLLG